MYLPVGVAETPAVVVGDVVVASAVVVDGVSIPSAEDDALVVLVVIVDNVGILLATAVDDVVMISTNKMYGCD